MTLAEDVLPDPLTMAVRKVESHGGFCSLKPSGVVRVWGHGLYGAAWVAFNDRGELAQALLDLWSGCCDEVFYRRIWDPPRSAWDQPGWG